MIPHSWLINMVTAEFIMFQCTVRKGRVLQKTCGILSEPERRKVHLCLKLLYKQSFNFTRIMDTVTRVLTRKTFVCETASWTNHTPRTCAKEILYCVSFKNCMWLLWEHRTVSIGFSTFAELLPEHYIIAGGTHTVCVCVIHQNITLTVQGAHLTAHFNATK